MMGCWSYLKDIPSGLIKPASPPHSTPLFHSNYRFNQVGESKYKCEILLNNDRILTKIYHLYNMIVIYEKSIMKGGVLFGSN